METIEPVLIDIATFRRLTGIGKTKTYEMIGNGDIASITIGRSRKIYLESVKTLLGLSPDTPLIVAAKTPNVM